MNFKNKVVLITGGSSDIGAAIALQFAKNGAKLVITGRNKTKLENTSKKCEEVDCKPLVIAADLTKDEDCVRVVSNTIDCFGKLDVFVSCSGQIYLRSILDDNVMELFDFLVSINLRAPARIINLAALHLIKSQGNIVVISGLGALAVLFPNNCAYAASRAGLDHFARSIAFELAPKGVRVNIVTPGMTKTDIAEKVFVPPGENLEKFWDDKSRATPLGRVSEPEEIADMVLYLASDKAKSVTGSTFVIDNGSLLKGNIDN